MAMIGEVDPRVQALFDDNLARTRRATAEVSAELKAGQDKVAADIEAREEKHKRDLAAAQASAENLGKQGEPPRKPQWERPDRGTGEMAFGPEDDDGGYAPQASAPPPPPVQPVAPPPPPTRPRRPAPVDDDDDLSGQTWLS
ncbi:hypothetical protein ACSHWB_10390 [Lentzea sp. HUAS TT2]|uniref:hypothetical protein n=1 Tax=Lentzea sp. HUAS TT2 TaxID=3447454 RepID=UPI003F727CD4